MQQKESELNTLEMIWQEKRDKLKKKHQDTKALDEEYLNKKYDLEQEKLNSWFNEEATKNQKNLEALEALRNTYRVREIEIETEHQQEKNSLQEDNKKIMSHEDEE